MNDLGNIIKRKAVKKRSGVVAIALLALRKTVRYFVKIFIPNEMESIVIRRKRKKVYIQPVS